MPAALLVAGTTSDAGKTVVTTALCRAFARRGVRVAPFKAQNMSNNSMVCAAPDGGTAEIGRAQWVQAVAAGATPEPAMNPVLLKPGGDRRSHVVVMGRPAGEISSADFVGGRRHLADAAYAAFDDLAERYDVVVCEGAGSPAEINLRAGDFVNMGLARHADIPTIVVGDIDRGGVFAAFYGTLALLDPDDQALVAGFVVNKFRGDESLLAPGLERLRELTGLPTYGVLPWHPDLWLDSEDALDLDGRRSADRPGALRVAVVRLPRISNFTDVDALGLEPDVDVVFASTPRALADADLVVVPGTRATIADLGWLRERGLDRAIVHHASRGGPVLGICGGFQMLGARIDDPDGVEGPAGSFGAGAGAARCHHDVRDRQGAPAAHRCRARCDDLGLRDPPRAGPGRRRRGVPRRCPAGRGVRHHVARQPGGRRLPARAAGRGRGRGGTRVGSVGHPFRRRARGPAGPARRPGGEAPGRRRAAPARGCRRVTQATPRADPCMRDSVSH